VSSLRPFAGMAAAVALVLASCGGQTAQDIDPEGGMSTPEPTGTAEPDPSGPGSGEGDPDVVDGAERDEASGPDTETATDPASQRAHAPAPEPAPPFELSPDEMLPDAKRLATEAVQTLLTYEPQDTAGEIAGSVAGDGRHTALVVAAAPLLHAGSWSRGEIVYPQLGGFTETSASVMVVARQTVGYPDGEVTEETRTLDVRLAIEDDEWVFDELASTGGRALERPDDLSEAAIAVVDDDRIELPDTARWDIYRGVIEEPMLELMALMAERTEYGVIVLDTGHPWEVFGTDRQSRHSLGRAVDVYRLSGPNVIDDREDGSDTHRFVQWLYEQPEMTNMGAPWALDDFGGRSFTDDLHQDHLHIESAAGDDASG
jgi:hypothetical protein